MEAKKSYSLLCGSWRINKPPSVIQPGPKVWEPGEQRCKFQFEGRRRCDNILQFNVRQAKRHRVLLAQLSVPLSLTVEWMLPTHIQFSSAWFFATQWTAAHQASISITNSQSLLKLMTIESVMSSNHLIFCRPLLLHLQSFPASGSFPVSQFFTSGGQSIVVSALASVLPMNIQDWFPLGLTGLISLKFKELSKDFSNTTVQKLQFFGTQFSL